MKLATGPPIGVRECIPPYSGSPELSPSCGNLRNSSVSYSVGLLSEAHCNDIAKFKPCSRNATRRGSLSLVPVASYKLCAMAERCLSAVAGNGARFRSEITGMQGSPSPRRASARQRHRRGTLGAQVPPRSWFTSPRVVRFYVPLPPYHHHHQVSS